MLNWVEYQLDGISQAPPSLGWGSQSRSRSAQASPFNPLGAPALNRIARLNPSSLTLDRLLASRHSLARPTLTASSSSRQVGLDHLVPVIPVKVDLGEAGGDTEHDA